MIGIDGGDPFDAGPRPDGGPRPGDSGPRPGDSGPTRVDAGRRDAGTIMRRDAGPPPDSGPPDVCPFMDLGMATGMGVATGSTTTARDDESPCGSSGAPDVVYTWTAPSTGLWVFDLRGSTYDTMLSILAGGCGGAEIDCNDDFFGLESRVEGTLSAGDVVAIVVDGFDTESGSYTLNITAAMPEDCTNGIDDDVDDALDCADSDCDTSTICHELGAQCSDMLDNDADGDTDCADFDCSSEPACVEGGPVLCRDMLDNDGDGAVDCADFDCDTVCQELGNCGDAFDNDADGSVDCADMDCSCDALCGGGGSICPTTDLGSAIGNGVAAGVLAAGSCSAMATSCIGSGGGETTYLWTAPATATYRFDTNDTSGAGGTYDTVLEIRDMDCTGPALGCNDDSEFGLLSSVTVSLTAGQVVVILLDAYSAAGMGNYTLNITML